MSYLLPELRSGWNVDQAIVTEEQRVVVIRWGRSSDPTCMLIDEKLSKISNKVRNYAVIYCVDLDVVKDFTHMYELYEPYSIMFFYRNKHILIDTHTGNNNKVTFDLGTTQDYIDIIETVYVGAKKGKGIVISPKDYSTKWKY